MFSCQKDAIVEGIAGLEFSTDTVAFDTVFTTMGTITRQVKVFNPSDNPVEIETLSLRGGRSSRFRLNVDGDTALVQHGVTILPQDSIFIFVRANINPNDETTPFVVEDAILLQGGNTQKQVVLTAWGRNAIYHHPDHVLRNTDGSYPLDAFGNPYRYSVIDCENWRHDLPHVIIGYAVVDSRNTLTLEEGDELYFHNDAVLWVFDSATINVRGTTEKPVLFTSVRHDSHYDKLPGQWGYIWLSSGSKDNEIKNAVIENGYVGILADTNVNGNPTLKIENTIIRNQSMAGIMGQTAWIEGDNVLVHTCGTATLALQYGGRYAFSNSTFADYWRYNSRTNPSVVLNNHYSFQGNEYLYDAMQVTFTDCIIYGNYSDGEMLIDLDDRVSHTLTINHSIVKGGDWDEDPLFTDTENDDYTLQENSPAQGIGWQKSDVGSPNH